MDAILDLNLTSNVLQPNCNDAILDLVFSSDAEVVSNVDILEPLGNSDHNMVLCDLNLPNSVTYKIAKVLKLLQSKLGIISGKFSNG